MAHRHTSRQNSHIHKNKYLKRHNHKGLLLSLLLAFQMSYMQNKKALKITFIRSFTFIYFVDVCVHMLWCTCGNQKITYRSWFSLLPFWFLGIKLSFSSFLLASIKQFYSIMLSSNIGAPSNTSMISNY